MQEATLIYPHQLFLKHPAIKKGRVIFLIEEPLFINEFKIHNQKLLLHRLSMQRYKEYLESNDYIVNYLDINSLSDSESVFDTVKNSGYDNLHIVDTTDNWLEKRIELAKVKYNFTLTRYDSPLFLLPKEEAVLRYKNSNKHLANFYKKLRLDKKILTDENDKPNGGQWSFDAENRKKIPREINLPNEIGTQSSDTEINGALAWLKTIRAEKYGETNVWLPWSHETAQIYLEEFILERLKHFGDYEDAILINNSRLFHSTLSPLLNIGLLTPQQVIDAAINYSTKNNVGINNLEGFVRQVIGWREFIRASYECDGTNMRTKNFWNHQANLPDSFWDASTNILPIDNAISKALSHGYNHHIERLMVLGNFMLLSKIHPDKVYEWFMAMYVDAYDWVMVPNVYGMSQFADGGIFATKPYISGSNYLKKMSDYSTGEWEELWTALYWNFIFENKDFFASNHRLSMMPKLLEKMSSEKRTHYLKLATSYLNN